MLRTAKLFSTLAIVLLLASCGSEGTELRTKNDFKVILHETQNGAKPEVDGRIIFMLRMTGPDSTFFDSWATGDTLDRRFPGLEEALQRGPVPVVEALHLLAVGDSATLYVPASSELETPPANFQNPDPLVYTLKVLGVKSAAETRAEQEAKQQVAEQRMDGYTATMNEILEAYNNKSLGNRLQTLSDGLQYVVIKSGNGAVPTQGNQVTVDYIGMLMNGEIFDSSIPRMQEFEFVLGGRQVIPGWDLSVAQMKEGDKWMVFLPSALAYGEMGTPGGPIPPNANLAFLIELHNAGN